VTELEITPEPAPDERAAIEAAVLRVLAGEANGPGAWWRAGVLESADEDDPV
jgi:hypothetical protein